MAGGTWRNRLLYGATLFEWFWFSILRGLLIQPLICGVIETIKRPMTAVTCGGWDCLPSVKVGTTTIMRTNGLRDMDIVGGKLISRTTPSGLWKKSGWLGMSKGHLVCS